MKDRFERFEKFTFLINNIYRDIQKIKLSYLKQHGLKGSHMMCMYYLGQSPQGMTFKELCELCHEDKSLISRNLSYLKKAGYIVDCSDSSKKYKSILSLSEDGKRVLEDIKDTTERIFCQVYLDKGENELDIFYDNLAEISSKIDLIIEKDEYNDKNNN